MAGGGEAEDNPVHMNVVAMVDIIFCLCVFFMCSFKFKQLEGKFQSWLPKNKGLGNAVQSEIIEIRIAMLYDPSTQKTDRVYGHRKVADGEAGIQELTTLIQGAYEDYVRRGKPDVPVIVDADFQVPWEEVMSVVNIAKKLSIQNIEFAMGSSQLPTAPQK
jgi:biopolymer transport protein ExbD